MEESKKAGFQFTGFQVIRSHIDKMGSEKVGDNLELNFATRGEKDETRRIFNLFLGVTISNTDKTFNVDVEVVGYFTYSSEAGVEIINNYFFINAPAILFPYVRAYISSLTALSGYETVTLPTINITFLGNSLKENTIDIHPEIRSLQ